MRARVEALLGIGGFETVPLRAESEEPVRAEGFTRTRVRFDTRPGLRALAHWIEPEGPVRGSVLCLPGHGQGAAALVGLADEPYQANFALQCARRGYRALALEPIGFGERRSSRVGPHGWSCEADARAALMLGETLLGWRVWEAMRSVDWLLAQPDAGPVAVMGISGGGTVGLWAAALDERISTAVISGAFCPFRQSILAIDHCLDNFVPGVLGLLDMPDLAGLIAPRGLFVENGTEDSIFPRAGFERAVVRAQAIYADSRVEDRFGFDLFDGGHEFRGEKAFAFLERVLGVL